MKSTVSQYDFEQAFRDCDRFDNFGYHGLKALYEYLEEYEDDCGEEIELDVIAICCDFSGYDTALEAAVEHGFEPYEDEDEDEQETSALDWLRDETTVIEHEAGVIIQSY